MKWLSKMDVRDWWRDAMFRRISGNAGLMFAGGAGGQALSFLALMLVARALGPEKLGMYAVIQAYVMSVGLLLSFQSWQGMIKYGAAALEERRPRAFLSLLKFGLLLDGGTAVIATLLAVAGVHLVGDWRGWAPETIELTAAYSLLILFRITGLPESVLRLYDRFRVLAILQLFMAAFRLTTIGIAFFYTAEIWVYLLLWGAAEAVTTTLALVIALRLLSREGYGGFLRSPLSNLREDHPGIGRFFLTNNATASMQLGVKELDIFLVAALLGPATTGMYKVAREIARIPAVLAGPIQQAMYPELARLWAAGAAGQFMRMIKRLSALGGAIGLGVWIVVTLAGPWILKLAAGGEYSDARWVLTCYMLSVVVFTFGIALRPAILSVGRPEVELLACIGASVLYFAALPLMAKSMGAVGVGLAQVVFQGGWFVGMTRGLRHPVLRALSSERSRVGTIRTAEAV